MEAAECSSDGRPHPGMEAPKFPSAGNHQPEKNLAAMSDNPNLLPAAYYGMLPFDQFILDRVPNSAQGMRSDFADEYLELGSKGRQIYHSKAAKVVFPVTNNQINALKPFLTIPERNLSIAVVQYEKVVLVRTCYEKGTDATFENILSRYGTVNFASILDDEDLYASNVTPRILRRLPFLVETARLARCNLMPKERQDKILALSSDGDSLKKNKIEVDKLLLMDNTDLAREALTLLTSIDLQSWSSIVGLVCLVDQVSMRDGLVKLYAFNDEGEKVWGSRISPKGLAGFMTGLENGKSVFELRHALRQLETSSGRRFSASHPSTKTTETPPISRYDTLRQVAKTHQAEEEKLQELMQKLELAVTEKDRAETERAVTMGANEDLHNRMKALSEEKRLAEEARDRAVVVAEEAYRKAGLSDCARRDAVLAMHDAERRKEHAELMCTSINNQLQQDLVEARKAGNDANEKVNETESNYKESMRRLQEELAAAKEAQLDAFQRQEHDKASCQIATAETDRMLTELAAAMKVSKDAVSDKHHAERVHEDDVLRLQRELLESKKAQEPIIVQPQKAITEIIQAEGSRSEAGVMEERSHNARFKAEAELQEAKQLKARVAEMQKKLEAKELLIVGAEEHEKCMTQRLWEEITAKEKAMNSANVLDAKLAQQELVLTRTGRLISDLEEQLDIQMSARHKFSEENQELAKELAQEAVANGQVTQENQKLKTELQDMKEEIFGKGKTIEMLSDAFVDLEKEMNGRVDVKEQLIKNLRDAYRQLEAQVSQGAAAKDQIALENQMLKSEQQAIEKIISATEDAHRKLGDQYTGLEKGMRAKVTCRERIINELQYANRTLHAQLSQVAAAKEKMAQEKQALESSGVEVRKILEAKFEAAEDWARSSYACEAKLIMEVGYQELIIGKLNDANRDLSKQLETMRATYNQLHRDCHAANQAVSAAQEEKMQLEKGLQFESTRHVEDMKQARQAIEQGRNAKELILVQLKATNEDLAEKLHNATGDNRRLELDVMTTNERLTYNHLSSQEEKRQSERKLDEMNAAMQKALASKKSAELDLAKWRDHFKGLYLKESEARVKLESECKGLNHEKESLEAVKEMEKHYSERETLLVGRLQATDITARDEMAKRERLEEELRVWRDEDGVIALD